MKATLRLTMTITQEYEVDTALAGMPLADIITVDRANCIESPGTMVDAIAEQGGDIDVKIEEVEGK